MSTPPTGSTPTRIAGQEAGPTSVVPAGTPGMVVAPQTQTNTLAVVSLVSALGAPFGHLIGVGGITLIIVSIVTGHMARAEIRKTGEQGAGLALAGLIISYVHLAVIAVVLIFFFGLILALIAGIFGAVTGSH